MVQLVISTLLKIHFSVVEISEIGATLESLSDTESIIKFQNLQQSPTFHKNLKIKENVFENWPGRGGAAIDMGLQTINSDNPFDATGNIEIAGNVFDLDPYLKHPLRKKTGNAIGAWTTKEERWSKYWYLVTTVYRNY
jgi:hypothetical protein